jgi:hypothetical protein
MNLEETVEAIAREKHEAREELRLYDESVWLGRPQYFALAEELKPGMRRRG